MCDSSNTRTSSRSPTTRARGKLEKPGYFSFFALDVGRELFLDFRELARKHGYSINAVAHRSTATSSTLSTASSTPLAVARPPAASARFEPAQRRPRQAIETKFEPRQEFSSVDNAVLNANYKRWSFSAIPLIGQSRDVRQLSPGRVSRPPL